MLRGRQESVHRFLQRGTFRKCAKFAHHCTGDGKPTRDILHLRKGRLLGCTDVNEQGNEDQERVPDQSDESEDEGESLSNTGSKLKRTSKMLMVINCAMRPPPSIVDVDGLANACAPPATNKPSAITTLTIGPATAMTNSCTGSSGIRSSRATPPMGSNVMSGVLMPKAFAANACPNSCSTTQRKSRRTNITRLAATAEPPCV